MKTLLITITSIILLVLLHSCERFEEIPFSINTDGIHEVTIERYNLR